MSPWVLPDRTQGTFRQYPGRHRPYQPQLPVLIIQYTVRILFLCTGWYILKCVHIVTHTDYAILNRTWMKCLPETVFGI